MSLLVCYVKKRSLHFQICHGFVQLTTLQTSYSLRINLCLVKSVPNLSMSLLFAHKPDFEFPFLTRNPNLKKSKDQYFLRIKGIIHDFPIRSNVLYLSLFYPKMHTVQDKFIYSKIRTEVIDECTYSENNIVKSFFRI